MKVAIITGANGNLGQAVVQQFLKENFKVIGLVHRVKENAFKSENYEEREVDLTNEEESKKTIDQITKQYNHIETAVLTAGGFAMGNIEKTGEQELEKQYRLNFLTAYNIARPLFLKMKTQQKGSLFFIGSEPGMHPETGGGVLAYALAKSQLFQLAKILNHKKEEHHVLTKVIVPTTIDTPENRKSVPDADFSKWQKPEDIAQIIFKHYTHRTAQEIIEIKKEIN